MADIKKTTYFFVNSFIIKGEKKTVLFDTGCVVEPEQLPGFLADNGVDPKEIDLIVVSHAHWDHAQLAAAWKDLTGAPIVCHEITAEYLRNGKKDPALVFGAKAQACQPFIDFMRETCPDGIPTVEADVIFGDEGFDLHELGFEGKLVHTPGHDDSCVALVLDDGNAFIGDTVIDLHTVGCLEEMYPPETFSLNWINTGEDVIKESVRSLLTMADTFYSGHGRALTRDEMEQLVK